jgi:Zn-dependent M16 (insulinase) family peptidase
VYSSESRKVEFTSYNRFILTILFKKAMVSFSNQALKNISRTYQIDLLEKHQAVTKDDVLSALKTYFLPLFDPSSAIAVVVTAPAKADEIGAGLKDIGFEVTQRVMEVDPNEMKSSEDGETDNDGPST